jgi:hypothetical protein
LEDGLDWNASRLAVDGRLWVVSTQPPVIRGVAFTGGNVVVSGTGGTPGWQYYVLASTNVALPLTQWTRVVTNAFDTAGNFSFTNAVETGISAKFCLLHLQQ